MFTFDPADWITLPNGAGLRRDDLGPCGQCGGLAFEVRACQARNPGADEWSEQVSVVCPACVPPRRERRDRETGQVVRTEERVVAVMDAITGAMSTELARAAR